MRVDVTTIFARGVWQLGLITLFADRIVHSLKTMMAPASPGPAFTGLLYG